MYIKENPKHIFMMAMLLAIAMATTLVTPSVAAGSDERTAADLDESAAANLKESSAPTVITGAQPTYSLVHALTADTPIQVVNVPQDGRRLASLKDYISRRTEQFEPLFNQADAVVAYTNVIGTDPLYRYARRANINLVYIDAAQPWEYDSPGVSLVTLPSTNVAWAEQTDVDVQESGYSPYFWLSPGNAVRMSDIIGNDLARVFPEYEQAIQENLRRLKADWLALSGEFHDRLLSSADTSVFALANEFVYLTNDMGIYVDSYFIKQDINWTDADLENLTHHLKSRDIQVVLHKWQPSEKIQTAVAKAGAKIVVLDSIDPGLVIDRSLVADGYQQLMRINLDRITDAFGSR